MYIRNLKSVGASLLLGMIGIAIAAAPSGEPKSTDDRIASTLTSTTAATTAPIPSFEALDADGDASLSKAEVPADAALAARFASYDQDRSDALSRAEYDRYAVNAADDLFADDE